MNINKAQDVELGANELDDTNGKAESAHHLPSDAYTFIFWCNTGIVPMLIEVGICSLQFLLFGLFLYNILSSLSVPKDVEIAGMVTQAVAIFVSFLAQDDLRTSLVAVIHQEGWGALENRIVGFRHLKLYIAYTLMGFQGLLGQAVSLMLILYSDNVFDLILNFTAVGFISQLLDEIVFHISEAGFMGRRAEKTVSGIKSFLFTPNQRRGWKRNLYFYLLLILMATFDFIFGYDIHQQKSHMNLPQVINVEFGDEIDPSLGTYSGCYNIQAVDGLNAQVHYSQMSTEKSQGRYHFCRAGNVRTCTFNNAEDDDVFCDEPGTAWLRSSEERPTSFDLLDANGDEWPLETGKSIESFRLVQVDIDTKDAACGTYWGGTESGTNNEPCSSLIIDVDRVGFSGSHDDWSMNFDLVLLNEEMKAVQFYRHPAYVGEFSDFAGFELVSSLDDDGSFNWYWGLDQQRLPTRRP
jgi:hypothetical protein